MASAKQIAKDLRRINDDFLNMREEVDEQQAAVLKYEAGIEDMLSSGLDLNAYSEKDINMMGDKYLLAIADLQQASDALTSVISGQAMLLRAIEKRGEFAET